MEKFNFVQRNVQKSRMEQVFNARGAQGQESNTRAIPRRRTNPHHAIRNDNKPTPTSAHQTIDMSEQALHTTVVTFDPALEDSSIFTEEVRTEFSPDVMSKLKGTFYDPNKFLISGHIENVSYLYKLVDPHKLIDYMVNYMRFYYDLRSDGNVFSEQHYAQDDLLWDNLAFIIPPLCLQIIQTFKEEPMIVIGIEPDVIIFGDIHGNFNDIYFIYVNFISKPKYATTKFIFLGDYVDRGHQTLQVPSATTSLQTSTSAS